MRRFFLPSFFWVLPALAGCASEPADYTSPPGFTPDDTTQVAEAPGVFVIEGERVVTASLADRVLRRRAEGKGDDEPSRERGDDRRLEVSMGASYADGARVSMSSRPRAHVEFRPLGASAASRARVRADGAVVAYENAYPGVTAAFGGGTRRVKEFLRVPDAGHTPELRYEVVKGPEFGRLEKGKQGELWAYDVDGGALFAVLPPLVKDARGVEVHGAWELLDEGGKTLVRAALDYQGLTYPLMIDPSFDTPRWYFDDDNEPAARGAAASAWFNTQQMAVVFGGIGSGGTYLNDARVRRVQTNSTVWRPNNVTSGSPTAPSPRAYAALAPRDSETAGYLFGGQGSGGELNDEMWRLVLSNGVNYAVSGTWAQVTPPSPKTATNWPSPRIMHGMAALDGSTILMFGGIAETGELLKDTWKWDGTSWTRICEGCFPGLYGFATVPGRARVAPRDAPVVFGGYDGATMSSAVYRWDDAGSTWSAVAIADAPIPTSDSGQVVASASPGTLSPQGRYLGYGFWTPTGNIVLGGGVVTTNAGVDTYLDDLWEWSKPGQPGGDRWVRQPSRQSLAAPGVRESPAALFFETDPAGDASQFGLLFGGVTDAGNGTVIRQTRLYRAYSDSVELTVRTLSATNYSLVANIDFNGLSDPTRIRGYFVRRVTTGSGPVWEAVPGCGTTSAPLSGSSGMVLGCTTSIASNPNTTAFGVMVRDRVFYSQPNGGNGGQCQSALANESIVLCGLSTAYPGQATCGLTGVSNTASCPAP